MMWLRTKNIDNLFNTFPMLIKENTCLVFLSGPKVKPKPTFKPLSSTFIKKIEIVVLHQAAVAEANQSAKHIFI